MMFLNATGMFLKEVMKRHWQALWILQPGIIVAGFGTVLQAADDHSLELSDEVVPYEEIGKDFLERPKPVTELIEDLLFSQNRERDRIIKERTEENSDIKIPERKTIFGKNPFLGVGSIIPGFEIPGGAVWQPTLIAYGEFRSAVQTFNDGDNEVTEWANRLDLFINLYLTPTERILFALRPFDEEGAFSGYRFGGDRGSGGESHFNLEIRSLFFEGDFGELFPNIDPEDRRSLDYGFAIGRQPVNFQDGIMLNDVFDAVGITRSSLFLLGSSATRITGMFGMNEIHRGNNVRDRDARIYGLFITSDYDKSTWDLDLAWVTGDKSNGGDGAYVGLAQTRRFGHINSTLRANFSWALDDESKVVGTGTLLTAQLSRTPSWNHDLIYVNAFWGIDDYTSTARDPAVGGPLGNIGILFAAVGLGQYGAPLGSRADSAVGAAIGYQHFLGLDKDQQIIVEIGGRTDTDGRDDSDAALGVRYQQAMGQHSILVLDAFGSVHEDRGGGYGARTELRFKF